MGVLERGSRVAMDPPTGLSRIFAFHSTGLARTKKKANQSDFRNRKGMEWRGWVKKKKKKLTCRSDPKYLLVVAGKQSYACDRSNMLD